MLILIASLVFLQATPAPAPASLINDVRKLTIAEDNDQRFEALTGMLRERNLPFAVEPFTIQKAVGREPRTRGRNIVVSLGEGSDELVIGAHYDAVRLRDGSLSPGAVDNGGLEQTCATEALDCVRFAEFPESDDRSFGKARIPTLSIAIIPAVEAHQLWLLLNGGPDSGLRQGFAPAALRTIHSAGDALEKVDGASMARMHRFGLALVRRLSTSQP